MTLPDSTIDALRTDLIAGINASNRRRRRRRMVAAVPVLAVLGGIGLVMREGEQAPAYAMAQHPDGTVRVQVFPDFDDVDGLRDSLRDVGLDASLIHLRSHPSIDGIVEVVSHDNEDSRAFKFDNGEFVIDAGMARGSIEILIYGGVAEGEDYQASPSVFYPEQTLAGLHCAYSDRPLPTADFDERLDEVGEFEVKWTIFGESDPETGSIDHEDFDERPDGFVTGAAWSNSDTVWVFVAPDTAEPAADSITMHDGTHYGERPVCTPELAEAWG